MVWEVELFEEDSSKMDVCHVSKEVKNIDKISEIMTWFFPNEDKPGFVLCIW